MNNISVQEAIDRGNWVITWRSRTILALFITLSIVLMFLHFSWLNMLLIPLGYLSGVLYMMLVIPKWRIWAYKNVDDIQQFQRSAKLAGLLPLQSYDHINRFSNRSQREELIAIQKKFLEPAVFVDDPLLPDKTILYSTSPFSRNKAVMALGEAGLEFPSGDLFTWDQIIDEHIASVGISTMNGQTGTYNPSGTVDIFRFECPKGNYETPMSSIRITKWKLDLLLYIYRGRYTSKQ